MPARVKRKQPKKASRPARRAGRNTSQRRAKPKSKPKKGKKPARAPARAKARRPAPKRPKKSAAKKRPKKSATKRSAARRPAAGKAARGAQAAKQRERARAEKERQRAREQRERERERAARERERERAQREKERERARAEKQREQAARQRERERAQQQKERERERARQQKERDRLAKERQAEKERQKKLADQERARKAAEREAEKKAREAERQRLREEARRAKEQERLEREAERERLREEARKAKEEERAKREAEREAYRKAKEAERERLRAEREAARRALEGKVARATKRALRVAGVGRGGTTRVYRPDLIPNQSGTTRRVAQVDQPSSPRAAEIPLPSSPIGEGPITPPAGGGEELPLPSGVAHEEPAAQQPAPPKEPPPENLDERYSVILRRLEAADAEFRREYTESFDMSWIYHDSALEGVVYTFQELKTAIDPNITVVPDSSLQPVCEEIRRHKAAIDLVRELAEKKRVPLNVDIIKKIYLTLHPEEGDLKSVKYRKDIPQHRLYFHEYAPPDKIAYRVRQVLDWLNGPEPKKIKQPIRIASRVHYDLLRIFPFPNDSGKVARLFMNLILLRNGYPPAIIHSTERQRYYEALKGSLPTIVQMVQEAILNALASIEKKLDERDTRLRAFSV